MLGDTDRYLESRTRMSQWLDVSSGSLEMACSDVNVESPTVCLFRTLIPYHFWSCLSRGRSFFVGRDEKRRGRQTTCRAIGGAAIGERSQGLALGEYGKGDMQLGCLDGSIRTGARKGERWGAFTRGGIFMVVSS